MILDSDINPIYELGKIIDQELYKLRPTISNDYFTINEDKRILLAQSIFYRSIDLNYIAIANKSREFLLQLKCPFLDIRWAKVHSKEALLMILGSTIKIWDLNTGELLNTLMVHDWYSLHSSVRSVAISTDNSKIVWI